MDPLTVGAISSIMGISCGIIAIIAGTISQNKKTEKEQELRMKIIENNIDAETAKLLITTEKKEKTNFSLFLGCMLIGFGLGYFIGKTWFSAAAIYLSLIGLGIGLLTAFTIDYKIKKAKAKLEKEEEEKEREKQNI